MFSSGYARGVAGRNARGSEPKGVTARTKMDKGKRFARLFLNVNLQLHLLPGRRRPREIPRLHPLAQ